MKSIIKIYFNRSPFISFFPFLLLYLFIVVKYHGDILYGDEERYLGFAQNILNGYYSPPEPNINLWNGPGYPILIAPFIAMGFPLISITFLNAIFQYLTIIFLFYSLKNYCSQKTTIIISCFWGFYYNAYLWEMPYILTESLSTLLITLICYYVIKIFRQKNTLFHLKDLFIPAFLIGFLALTKIIFGYVLICLLSCSFLFYLFKKSIQAKKWMICLSLAFAVNVPYLIYTHSLTNKICYWGNSGGMSLYWMSTPFEGEFGDWLGGSEYLLSGDSLNPLYKNHKKDMQFLIQLKGVALDDAYKKLAIHNIKTNPRKYLKNCGYNISRLLFDFPYYTVSPSKKYVFRILPTCILLPFILCAAFLGIRNFAKMPLALKLLCVIALFYFGFTITVSAYNRQFYIVVPLLLILTGYVLFKKKDLIPKS